MQIESRQPPTRVILEHASPWGRWLGRAGWIVAGIALLSAIGSAGAFQQYFQRDERIVETATASCGRSSTTWRRTRP